jgi:hypothetical protein
MIFDLSSPSAGAALVELEVDLWDRPLPLKTTTPVEHLPSQNNQNQTNQRQACQTCLLNFRLNQIGNDRIDV